MIKKLLAISLVFTSMTFAQESNVGKQLSLQDCIKIAVARNSTVLQAQYQAESQNARVLQAYGGLLPSVSAQGQFQYNQSTGIYYNGVYIPTGTNTSRSYTAGVGADYTLFNGFANYATVNSAKSNGMSADLGFERAKQNAVYQTTQLYLTVFQNRDQLKVVQDNLKRDEQQLESIKEANTVGSASLADVYQQQVAVSNDEYQIVQAQNNYDKSRANLKFFLGISVADSISFADSEVKSDIDTTEFAQVNQKYSQSALLLERAYETRPDFQAANESVDATESQLTVAKAAYSPILSATTQYGFTGPRIGNLNQTKSFYGGLTLTLPLFNGFQTQTNIQIADVNLKTAQQNLDVSRRQVQLDVYQAMLDLYASEKQYQAAVNGVASAQINLETAQEKYRIGGATLLDVLTADAGLTNALSNQVVAAYSYINAKQEVEFAIGTINY